MAMHVMSQSPFPYREGIGGASMSQEAMNALRDHMAPNSPRKYTIPEPEREDPSALIAASQLIASAACLEVLKRVSVYYVLSKMAEHVASQRGSNFTEASQRLQDLDKKMDELHKVRAEARQKKNENEQASKNWGVAFQVFSWITSFLMAIGGATLIASGAAGVAGAMLLAGGVVSITSQIMDIAGGWRKILDLLPGKNLQEKIAVLGWIQVAILVLCTVLSASGAVLAGRSSFTLGSQMASSLLPATAVFGRSVCTIGKGRADSYFYEALAEIEEANARRSMLRFGKEDIMEEMDESNRNYEQSIAAMRAVQESVERSNNSILRAYRRK